jgi:uncharacterized membrane protein YqjE
MKTEEHSNYGIAALVLGIIAILLAWVPFFGLLISIIALVISIIAVKKHEKYRAVGMTLSIISLLIALVIGGLTVLGVMSYKDLLEEEKELLEQEKEDLEEHNIFCNKSSAKTLSPCKLIIGNGSPKNKIDLAFVAVNYTSLKDVYSEVDKNLYSKGQIGDSSIFPRGLFETEPFKSNQNKFNVYVIENTCLDLEYIYKNTTALTDKVVSSCPNTDQIVVIVNTDQIPTRDNRSVMVGGWAIVAENDPVGFAITSSRENKTYIAHEFGHSFAFLCDEYFRTKENFTEFHKNSDLTCPNCAVVSSGNENVSCPKWKDVPGTGCYRGCEYNDLFRSEPLSIMGIPESQEDFELMNFDSSSHIWHEFNLVSKIAIEKRLKEYS